MPKVDDSPRDGDTSGHCGDADGKESLSLGA